MFVFNNDISQVKLGYNYGGGIIAFALVHCC